MSGRMFGVAVMVLAVMAGTVSAGVIPDYDFVLVNDKPGVIPGYNLSVGYSMGVTNPNPLDTGAGLGHQYLALSCRAGSYTERILVLHRNDVTAYDDFEGKDSVVEQLNRGSNTGDDGRNASVEGTTRRVYGPMGRMTHEDYWPWPTGSSSGPYNEWQPRDARSAEATYNQFLVYPDSDAGADGLAAHHTTTSNSAWGCSGYNKRGGVYVETLNAGTGSERIRFLSYGTHYSSGAWGSGMFELGPYTAGADPMQDLGTRSILSTAFFMTAADFTGLVGGVADSFKSWFHDGQYLYYLSADGTDVYLSAVEITDWDTGAWSQVDISTDANLYQTFSFNSGSTGTSLMTASGLVFAPDPDNPGGDPLLYIVNGANRIFVLEAQIEPPPVAEPAGLGLMGLALLGLRKRRS
jgi:hypothetical protein